VIIKDITNGSNCAVAPITGGTGAGANTLVGAINGTLGLNAPAAFLSGGGVSATGAFGICSAIAGQIATPSAPIRALLGVPTGALPYEVFNAGVPVNIRGNELPQAPDYKFNIGVQYEAALGNGMTLTPRVDYVYTGSSYGNIFNGPVNKIEGYGQLNAALEVSGPERKWYARAFVANVTDNDAITGLYVTDQSSGLFTNVFALDPRRYGLSVGMKF
jgi:iron complex outermembrane recepter protein